jgi:hypothetical protein
MNCKILDAEQTPGQALGLSAQSKSAHPSQRCLGLLHRRERWGLSWRGWLAAGGLAALVIVLFVFRIYPFLAVTERQPSADCLVVEGWVPADILKEACVEFHSGGYRKLLVSGCVALNEWTDKPDLTYAELGAAKLRRLGLANELIQPIPCLVQHKDRTYSSALAVKQWLAEHDLHPKQINVVTDGAHARRSRLLFQKAFGQEAKVGIIAVPDPQFDPDHWWQTSEGFREVVGETIAYLYARLLFHPPKA